MQSQSHSNALKTIIFLLLSFVNAKSLHHHQPRTLEALSRLLQGHAKPLVVLLTGDKQQSYDFDELDSTSASLYDEDDDVERDSYLLYNLIKTTQDEEQLDSSAESKFDNTKAMLRSAVRSRCLKRNKCEQKCPPKKPSCALNCQKVFDELNACEEPTTCKPSTTTRGCRGKTMPPKWLRLLRMVRG